MLIFRIILAMSLTVLASCATRAPSNYELDRRSGMSAPDEETRSATISREVAQISTGSEKGKESYMPARVPAVIERVWIYDQKLGGDHWMQGTWVFLQVDGEKWLPELESEFGNLIEDRNTINIKKSHRK